MTFIPHGNLKKINSKKANNFTVFARYAIVPLELSVLQMRLKMRQIYFRSVVAGPRIPLGSLRRSRCPIDSP